MRKLLAILVVTTLLMLMAVPAFAQCGRYRHRHSNVTHTHYSCIGDLTNMGAASGKSTGTNLQLRAVSVQVPSSAGLRVEKRAL